VAKRLSLENTNARPIGSRVTLLITIPRMVSVLSEVDCAYARAPLKQTTTSKKRIERGCGCRVIRWRIRGEALEGEALENETWCSPLITWTAPKASLSSPIIVSKDEICNSEVKS
jgi:hypothetical protein